jgi:hypothetical protein
MIFDHCLPCASRDGSPSQDASPFFPQDPMTVPTFMSQSIKGSYDESQRAYFTDVDTAKAGSRRAVLDKWTRRIEPPRDRVPS